MGLFSPPSAPVNQLAINNKHRRLRTIVSWGDSITANASVFSGGSSSTSGTVLAYAPGYAETLIRTSGRWSQVNNAGIAGQTSAQILARFAVDVLAYQPDACLIMSGTNDFVSGMTNAAMQAALQNDEKMVKLCLINNILPILVTPPPKNTATLESRVFASFLYDLADYYNIPLFDLHRLLVDPQAGTYASGTTYSVDGTHPSPAGIALIQAQFSALLANIESYITPQYMDPVSNTTNNQTITNLLRNGSFAYAAAPPTPDSWTVNGTNATQTLNAVGLGVSYPYTGNEVQYVKSSAGAVYALYGSSPVVITGNKMRLSGSISVSGMAVATATGLNLGVAFGSGYFQPFRGFVQNGNFDFACDFIVPSGQTTVTGQLYVPDIATLKVRNLTLIDLTARAAVYTPGQV